MPRTFKFLYIEELKEKIGKLRNKATLEGDDHAWPVTSSQIQDDLKVEFDWENFEYERGSFGPQKLMGLNTLKNGLTFCGMCAGGDWEQPVFFIVYWDGKKLRAYVPTKGNPYNTDRMCAYGNDEKSDDVNRLSRDDLPFNGDDFDQDLIIEDIIERITEKRR